MKDHPIVLFVSFKARPGRARELREELLALSETSLREPGCQAYKVHADLQDESRVWLYEHWVSEKALHEHDLTEHVAAFVRKLPELTETGFDRWRTTPVRRP